MNFRTKAVFLSVVLAATHTTYAEEKTWDFTIEPYLSAASIKGVAGMGRVAGAPVDVDFSTILENLSMAAMVHFEAQHQNGWGIVLDYGFMDLGADTTVGFGGVVDASVRQGIFEGMVSRKIGAEDSGLEVLAGIRWWDNQVRASFDPAIGPGSLSARIDEDWVDPIVGIRWTNTLSENWKLRLRGDIGGFGVSADSTWSASATALYTLSDRFVLEFGYRAIDVDYDNGNAANEGFFAYDTTTHGPLVGLIIGF